MTPAPEKQFNIGCPNFESRKLYEMKISFPVTSSSNYRWRKKISITLLVLKIQGIFLNVDFWNPLVLLLSVNLVEYILFNYRSAPNSLFKSKKVHFPEIHYKIPNINKEYNHSHFQLKLWFNFCRMLPVHIPVFNSRS